MVAAVAASGPSRSAIGSHTGEQADDRLRADVDDARGLVTTIQAGGRWLAVHARRRRTGRERLWQRLVKAFSGSAAY
jgi:hypothetical protein